MKEKLTEAKRCQSCGEDTKCSSSGKCWCFDYDLAQNVDKLEIDFGDCVCESCLVKTKKGS